MSALTRSLLAKILVVVGGSAVVAILAIGIAYWWTESDRQDIAADAQSVNDLQRLASQLTVTVRDEESAIDDYLLAQDPASVTEYRAAASDAAHLADQIEFESGDLPGVKAAVQAVTSATAAWQSATAEPAIHAVALGQSAQTDQTIIHDSKASHAALASLATALATAESSVGTRSDALNRSRSVATGFGLIVVVVGAALSVWFIRRRIVTPLERLVDVAAAVEAGTDVSFPSRGRDEVARLGAALERMRQGLQTDSVRSEVFNRFTENTVFAGDDQDVAASNLEALALLVHPDAAVTHILNRSKDRAIPEATRGEAIADVLPLNSLSRCPGIVRGSVYVTDDVAEPLSVHCPIYPVEKGTLACVPLAHGETVGAVHLYWEAAHALPLELRASVARVAEHAALAIGNRRLLAALHGQANTDARTGLANSRAFDQVLEDALLARADDQSVAVLMLDLDHFKDFNDRHGHPAGDEALRAFAGILRSCLRDADVAARYGGEEFAVVLPGADEATALGVAERIRSRTDSTLVSLAPGLTDRISVSIGLALAPIQGLDRVVLLRVADDALYQAKQLGRNRVCYLGAGPVEPSVSSLAS